MAYRYAFQGNQGRSHSIGGNSCGRGESSIITSTISVHTSIAASISAGADAVGVDTSTHATIDMHAVSRGLFSYVIGSVETSAAARSPVEANPYATAYAFGDFMNADLVVSETRDTCGNGSDGISQFSSYTSQFDFLAIDAAWLNCSASDLKQSSQERADRLTGDGGNVADFAVVVDATGEGAFTDVNAGAIAIEDRFSSSALSVSAAVSQDTTYAMIVGGRRDDRITTSSADSLIKAGDGNDTINAKNGDDWLFAGKGNDSVQAGEGNNTVFGGDGRDTLNSGAGEDWIFGGDGDDTINSGGGDDIVHGGDDKDRISTGAGNDLIDAGSGNDIIDAGAGNDTMRLADDDDDDRFTGGLGADLYIIDREFGSDTITDFSLAQGDALHFAWGNWGSDAALSALNGTRISLARGRADAKDLVITTNVGCERSELVLDDFFKINSGFGAAPTRGNFADAQALPILHALLEGSAIDGIAGKLQLFAISDYLSDLG
jgi:Ca2+-binding RTX toxin-like protein